ncbi:LysR family transcriptional regulator [Muricoccus radiodurans]|uniref:LysR family transcriptional regulator n=1 Tax=Muricoccus radiodurans TaxID=2231721 RepID=UPI003CEC4799
MELRQLRYFVAVARQQHFGRAAQRLNIAQPALSRQVQQLEEELGVRLFDRHTRGASLTPDGQRLLTRAEALLAEAETLRQDAHRGSDGPSGTVSLGVSPGMAELLAVPLVTACARQHPEIRLRIVSGFSPLLHDWALEGRLDMVILSGAGDPTRFAMTPLLREPLCLLCRADDRRFPGTETDLAAVAAVPLVLTGPPEAALQRVVNEALTPLGLTLDAVAQVDTAAVSKRLVLAGLGPTIDVAAMARAEIAQGLLKALPIGNLQIHRTLARLRDRQASPAAAAVAAALSACARDLVATQLWPGATAAA